MKKFIVCFFLLFGATQALSVTIGVVNMQKILAEIEEGKKANKRLKKEVEKKQAILKKEEEKFKKAQEDYQKQNLVLSDTAKAKKERELQEKYVKIQQQSLSFQKEIQKLENELKKPIFDKLKPIIEKVSLEQKIEVAFEANSSPILFAKNPKDITNAIIKAYNKKYPTK